MQIALELGVPVSAIAESVFARSASGDRPSARRRAASSPAPNARWPADDGQTQLVDDVRDALWSAKVVAYAQGLEQIRKASENYDWGVDIATVARIWRGGCIIRARLLKQISDEYAAGRARHPPRRPEHPAGPGRPAGVPGVAWSRRATTAGVPVPGFSSALAYYDTVRAERLPAALVQGLRDNFGAHTYRRVDREGTFHTLWSADRSEVEI